MGQDQAATMAAYNAQAMRDSMSPFNDAWFDLSLLIPIGIGLAVLYGRWRAYNRMKRASDETIAKLNRSADDLAQTAARQREMIKLLTEIRDRLPPPAGTTSASPAAEAPSV